MSIKDFFMTSSGKGEKKPKREDVEVANENQKPTKHASKRLEEELRENPFYGLAALIDDAEASKALAVETSKSLFYARVSLVVLAIFAAIGWLKGVEYRYFFINSKGHVYETTALKQPLANQQAVINFAEEVATGLHTYSYRNYLERFREMRSYCDDDTISAIYTKLKKTGVFDTAKRYKQRYEGLAIKMAIIKEANTTDGKAWRLRGLVNEEVIGVGNPISKDFSITIDIKQVPLDVNPQGIQCVRVDENYATE